MKSDYCAPIPGIPGHSLVRKANDRLKPFVIDYRDSENIRSIKLDVKLVNKYSRLNIYDAIIPKIA